MHMKKGDLVKNIIIIAVILVAVFLSQQPYFKKNSKNLFSQATKQINVYLVKTGDWLKAHIYPKVSGEVAKGGAVAQEEIKKQKNNILQNIWENIKNYFAEKFSKTFGTKVK